MFAPKTPDKGVVPVPFCLEPKLKLAVVGAVTVDVVCFDPKPKPVDDGVVALLLLPEVKPLDATLLLDKFDPKRLDWDPIEPVLPPRVKPEGFVGLDALLLVEKFNDGVDVELAELLLLADPNENGPDF